MGWWEDHAPTWLGGKASKPPLPPQAYAAASQLQSAQQDAQKNLNPNPPPDGGCLPCQATAGLTPCDLENFKVVVVRHKPNNAYAQARGGSATVNLTEDNRTYPKTFTFAPKAPPKPEPYANNATLEFVGGDKTKGIKTEVTVSFDVPFKCREHDQMEVVNPQGEHAFLKGVRRKVFELEYLPKKIGNLARKTEGGNTWEFGSYWLWGIHPMDTKVAGVVCGVRKGGATAWGTTAVILRCWPPDELELKLSIPSLYARAGEESSTRVHHLVDGKTPASVGSTTVTRNSTRTTERDLRTDFLGRDRQTVTTGTSTSHRERGEHRTAGTTTTSNTETLTVAHGAVGKDSLTYTTTESSSRGQLTGLSESVSTTTGGNLTTKTVTTHSDTLDHRGLTTQDEETRSGVVFYVKRGGEVLSNAFHGLAQILNIIALIKQKWAELRAFLEKNKPTVDVQCGWRFTFSFDLFSGEVSGKWAWREWSDHRAWFTYAFTLALKIFTATADVNFGVGITVGALGITVTFSAVIGVTGDADFRLEGSLERPDPDSRIGASVKLKGSANLKVYIKAVAGSEDKASAEAALKLPFEAEGAPKVTRASFGVEFSAKIKPTVATLDCHVKFIGSFQREHEVLPEKVFCNKKLIPIVGG